MVIESQGNPQYVMTEDSPTVCQLIYWINKILNTGMNGKYDLLFGGILVPA
jgi:hypothetical protein